MDAETSPHTKSLENMDAETSPHTKSLENVGAETSPHTKSLGNVGAETSYTENGIKNRIPRNRDWKRTEIALFHHSNIPKQSR